MTDLKASSNVPTLSAGYLAALNQGLTLQEHDGWIDYLLPTSDTLAAIAVLVGNNIGHFMVLESNSIHHRWLWMSPEARDHLMKNGWSILESAVAESTVFDARALYSEILQGLARDSKGRKIHDSNLVAK